LTPPIGGNILDAMPDNRTRMLPLLLPSLVVIPLAGLLVILLAAQWRGLDAREGARGRLGGAAAAVSARLGAEARRQREVTELLGRSPMAWLWVKFQGERLTASNRSHAQMALGEVANYGRLLPGAAVYLASERTRAVYRDGAAVAALRGEPADAWYTRALAAEGVVTAADAREVRTSLRVMDGTRLLGAVSCVRPGAELAAEALAAAAGHGISAALADAAGAVAAAAGLPPAGGVADLFDEPSRAAVRAAVENPGPSAEPFAVRVGGRPSLAMVSRLEDPPGWTLVAVQDVSALASPARSLLLAAVMAAALAAVIGASAWIFAGRMAWAAGRMSGIERERAAAAADLVRVRTAAGRAARGLSDLDGAAERLQRETEAAERALADADGLFQALDERDGELRSGIAGRLALVERIAAAGRETAGRARALDEVSRTVGLDAARGEEELGRLIAAGEALATAVLKAAAGAASLEETAGRVRLLGLTAALEAGRAGRDALERVASDMGRRAEELASRARALAEAAAEARAGMDAVSQRAREAGIAVHDAAAAARRASGAAGAAWDGAESLLGSLEASGLNARLLGDRASEADQERSALAGLGRIVGRLAEAGRHAARAARSARGDAEEASRGG
jgi:hypothetical protein